MTPADLKRIQTWFAAYAKRFLGKDPETDRAVRLKIAHTARVVDNITQIGMGIGLVGPQLILAQTAALLHDTGRFRQYHDYGTFIDRLSVNHARMGVREIGKEKVLAGLGTSQRRLICRAVAWHNAPDLPIGESEEVLNLTRLLRDADKVDIFHVTLNHYEGTDPENSIVNLGLPDSEACAPAILATFEKKEVAPFDKIATLNDFKLAQLSWVFDLQFSPTCRIVAQRRVVPRLAAVLPRTPEIAAAVERVGSHLRSRCQDSKRV